MTLDNIKLHSDFLSVESMYLDYVNDDQVLQIVLQDKTELSSFYRNYNDIFPKLFTVACANFFEKIICEFIKNCFYAKSELMAHFVSNQALERKYHAMFNWDQSNANKFYGLFGKNFLDQIKTKLSTDIMMKDSEKSFMDLGRFRNEIVHKGISTYNLSKSASDIYEAFQKSINFLSFLFFEIKNCLT